MTSVILALFPCLLATTVVATEAATAPEHHLEDRGADDASARQRGRSRNAAVQLCDAPWHHHFEVRNVPVFPAAFTPTGGARRMA